MLRLQIMATHWTRTWASTADVVSIMGQAVEEAAYDAESLWGRNLPDTSCIDDWVAKMPQLNLGRRLHSNSG